MQRLKSMLTAVRATAPIAIAMVAAATNVAQAASPPAPPRHAILPLEGGVVTNPDWVSLPSGDQLESYYPKLAALLLLPGRAKMSCTVNTTGTLDNCKIESETPAGFGFGAAGLMMTPHFRMKPMTVDGDPVGGAEVIIPLNFTPPPSEAPPAPYDADAKPPGARSLALARRLAAAVNIRERTIDNFHKQITQTIDGSGDAEDTPEQQIAVSALNQAEEADASIYEDAIVYSWAQNFSSKELAALVIFFQSPAGRSWNDYTRKGDQTAFAAYQIYQERVRGDATRILCLKIACATPPATPREPSAPKDR